MKKIKFYIYIYIDFQLKFINPNKPFLKIGFQKNKFKLETSKFEFENSYEHKHQTKES